MANPFLLCVKLNNFFKVFKMAAKVKMAAETKVSLTHFFVDFLEYFVWMP